MKQLNYRLSVQIALDLPDFSSRLLPKVGKQL